MHGHQDATIRTHDRPLPFWRARPALPEDTAAVFDRVTGELYERDEDGWRRTSAWPRLRARRRRLGRARWQPSDLLVHLHWPPRPGFQEDTDADRRGGDVVDARFVLGACASDAWARLIPTRVRQLVAAFAERHGSLLRWAAGGPACIDLLATNPALAALAAECRVLGGPTRVRDVAALQACVEAGASQRALLARLDLPATESARRLLTKVRPESLGFDALCGLPRVLGDAAVTGRLRHLPEVTRAVTRIAADPSVMPLASDGLLRSLVDDERRQRLAGAPSPDEHARCTGMRLATVARWRRELGREEPLAIGSQPALHRALRALLTHLVAVNQPGEERPLPPPPFPGTEAVVPLTTTFDLVGEGLRMRHCAGSMAGAVAAGEVFLYRVLAPERATLAIEQGDAGWRVRDLRGRWNQDVAASTWDAIEAWLRAAAGR